MCGLLLSDDGQRLLPDREPKSFNFTRSVSRLSAILGVTSGATDHGADVGLSVTGAAQRRRA
jgi:hypothetical protein